MFIDDIQQIREELQSTKQGNMPPLLSFVINGGSGIVAFIVAFFFVFPMLRSVFNMGLLLGLFLTIGTFVFVSAFLAEIVTTLLVNRQSKKA